LFTLLDGNATVAAAKAAAVIRVETALAQVALPADEIRSVADPFALCVDHYSVLEKLQ
jgi:hypothetical protein